MARLAAALVLLFPCAAAFPTNPPLPASGPRVHGNAASTSGPDLSRSAEASVRVGGKLPDWVTTNLAHVGSKSATTQAAQPFLSQVASPPTRRTPKPRASRSLVRKQLVLRDLGIMRVTKYCSTGNRTASDVWPQIGMAATLDRGIPFGTKLRILGDLDSGRHIDQTFIVTDRIGHGSDVDLYAGGEGDPGCEPRVNRTWGLQHLDVQVVR